MNEPKIKEPRWSKELEKKASEYWVESKPFAFKKGKEHARLPVYYIDTPPPYVNTPIHVGYAFECVVMDAIARYKRMKGYNVIFPFGLDRNGLPIEVAAEKKFGKRLTETPRAEFLELCKKVLEESSAATQESLVRLGTSFTSWEFGHEPGDAYQTDSEEYRKLTQATFIDLYNKGMVYEDSRVNNYCVGCQTTLADSEIDYVEKPSKFNDVVFSVKETGEKVTIGTTRPELVCTCGMIVFHPDDERFKHLNGKTGVTPLFGKEVPIKAHPQASMEKGTGLVMMCSAGDLSDIRFFREQGLEPVIAISKNGRMNENAGFLQGLKVKEARQKMVEALKEKGLLAGQRDVMHRTPVCERSKDEIEFIAMPELYVRQVEFKDALLEASKEMKFFDEGARKILEDWVNSVSIDWPISRRRYYSTEVPLWYCAKCSHVVVPEKGKYYKPWMEKAPIEACPKCKSSEFKGDERVLDTWFDSSNTPLYNLQYSRDDSFFKENFPASLRPQGKEITRTWLYYTLLKSFLLTKKAPFKDVWIHHHILDEKGVKMSKSLGNVIDPRTIIERFGAEPFRLWAALEGNLTKTDLRCSFDRIEGAAKTLNKLWNVARFISSFEERGKPVKLEALDAWILAELDAIIKTTNKCFDSYDFHTPSQLLRTFLWETFSSHYLELVKNRAYNKDNAFSKQEQDSALFTLHYCLDSILRVWAPVIPFITSKVYRELKGKDVHLQEFPFKGVEAKSEVKTGEIAALNSAIWAHKKETLKVALNAPLEKAVLPESLKAVSRDVIAAHGIKKASFGPALSF
ncbi:MAG TPA: valine--tRNA ligase [archaeon]|nr:valine--tRNA ligase [archaeon]